MPATAGMTTVMVWSAALNRAMSLLMLEARWAGSSSINCGTAVVCAVSEKTLQIPSKVHSSIPSGIDSVPVNASSARQINSANFAPSPIRKTRSAEYLSTKCPAGRLAMTKASELSILSSPICMAVAPKVPTNTRSMVMSTSERPAASVALDPSSRRWAR